MAGNHNSGRKPKYLTVAAVNEFLNNHFFHLKVETRVQSFIVVIILIIVSALAIRVFGG